MFYFIKGVHLKDLGNNSNDVNESQEVRGIRNKIVDLTEISFSGKFVYPGNLLLILPLPKKKKMLEIILTILTCIIFRKIRFLLVTRSCPRKGSQKVF